MVLLVADSPWQGPLRDRTLSILPGLNPWVINAPPNLEDQEDRQHQDQHEDEDENEAQPSTHSYRSGPVKDELLAALILLVHEQDDDFILMPDDLSWAVSAYDGGVDVVMRNPDEAEVLAGWLWPWLPPRGWPGIHSWSRDATQREQHRGLGIDATSEDEDAN